MLINLNYVAWENGPEVDKNRLCVKRLKTLSISKMRQIG